MPTTDVSKNIYVCPDFHPYNSEEEFKGLWLHLTSRAVAFSTSLAGMEGSDETEGGLIVSSDPGPQWYFLLPEQVMETINSSWEPWETMASRLAGYGIELAQIIENSKAIKNAVKSTWSGGNIVGEAFKVLTSASKVQYKVDTPLVYSQTERREWVMQLNLVADNSKNATNMMNAVRILRDYSLPIRKTNGYGLGIDYPYVFELNVEALGSSTTTGSDIIDIGSGYCALTSFQPTYMSPYTEDGDPMRIELTLTFKELSPRYGSHDYI